MFWLNKLKITGISQTKAPFAGPNGHEPWWHTYNAEKLKSKHLLLVIIATGDEHVHEFTLLGAGGKISGYLASKQPAMLAVNVSRDLKINIPTS